MPEVNAFKDALRISGKKNDVVDFNFTRIGDLHAPVVSVKATHEGPQAGLSSTDK